MNKFAKGCAAVLGVGIVIATGASYYVYHKVNSAVVGFAQLGSLPELDRSVRVKGHYTPASDEPSRAQLDRLLQVQQAVRTRLGARLGQVPSAPTSGWKTLSARSNVLA